MKNDDRHSDVDEYEDVEYDEPEMSSGHRAGEFLAGILLGGAIGAGIALLFAPQEGRRTRANISRRVRHIKDDASDRWDEAKHDVQRRVKRQKRRMRRQLKDATERTRDRVGSFG